MWTLPNPKLGVKQVGQGNRLLFKQLRETYAPSKSACRWSPKAEKTEWSHYLQMSPATIHHTEALCSIVRGIYGREHDDPMSGFGCEYGYLGEAYFWMRLCEQQFILDKDKWRIYDLPRINSWYSENNHFKDMNRIDGMPKEFEWKTFPGITALSLLEKFQKLLTDLQCEPEHFKDRIIFLSILNDTVWDGKGNEAQCEHNLQAVAEYARKFPRGHWSFLWPGSEENGTEPTPTNQMDPGIEGQKNNVGKFLSIRSSDISCLQCLCKRNNTKQSREKEVDTRQWSHWNHRVTSPHSDFCESTQYLRSKIRFVRRSTQTCQGSGETCSTQAFGKGGNPCRPLWGRKFYQWTAGETYGKSTSENSSKCQKDQKLSKLCSDAGLRLIEREQYFYTLENTRRTTNATLMQRVHAASQWRGDSCKRMDSQEYEDRTSLEYKKFAIMMNDTVSKFKFHLYFKTTPFHALELWTALTDMWQNQCQPRKKRTQLRGNPLPKQDQDRSLQ